jgi:hypothetical protein
MRRLRLLAASSLAAAAITLLSAGSAVAAVPREFFGVVSLNPPSAAEFGRMGNGHVGTFRTLLNWSSVEPLPGLRNWEAYDTLFSNAAINGIRVMPTLYSSPKFAAPVETRPPTTPAARASFIKFVSDAVHRYGTGGTFWRQFAITHPGIPALPAVNWQLWNEVNNPGFWLPKPNGKQYAKLLKPVHAAVRSADPSSFVITAGLFPRPNVRHGVPMRAWLKQFYKVKGIKNSFEGLAVHPYAKVPNDALKTVRNTRKLLRKNHDAKTPIWITELGWATGGSPSQFTTSLAGQASNLQASFSSLANNASRFKIGGVIWYALRDAAGSANWAYYTGLFDANGKAKPSWSTFVSFSGGTP